MRHKNMASITREHDLSPSSSSIIMWGSRPLLTVSTANRLVLHSAEVVHFHHKSSKNSEEFWTQPCDAGQASYHTTEVWLHRDATSVVWTSLGPLHRWVPGPTTRWAPGTTRLALHGTWRRGAQGLHRSSTRLGLCTCSALYRSLLDVLG
jgi:hypothetical protein